MAFDFKRFFIDHIEKIVLAAVAFGLVWSLVPPSRTYLDLVDRIKRDSQSLDGKMRTQSLPEIEIADDLKDPSRSLDVAWGKPMGELPVGGLVADIVYGPPEAATEEAEKAVVVPPESVEAVSARGAIVVVATVDVEKQLDLLPRAFRREAVTARPGLWGAPGREGFAAPAQPAGPGKSFLVGYEVYRKQVGVDKDFKLIARKEEEIPISHRTGAVGQPGTRGPEIPGATPAFAIPPGMPAEAPSAAPSPPSREPSRPARPSQQRKPPVGPGQMYVPPGQVLPSGGPTYPGRPEVAEEEEERIEIPEGDIYYLDKDVKPDEEYVYKICFLALNPAAPAEASPEERFIRSPLAGSPESAATKILEDVRFFFVGGTPQKVSLLVQRWIYEEKPEEEEAASRTRGLSAGVRGMVPFGEVGAIPPEIPRYGAGVLPGARREPSEIEKELGVGGHWVGRTFVLEPGQRIGSKRRVTTKKGEEYETQLIDFYTGCTLVDVITRLRMVKRKIKVAKFTEEGEVQEFQEREQVIPKKEFAIIYIDRKGRLQTMAQGAPPLKKRAAPRRERQPARPGYQPTVPGEVPPELVPRVVPERGRPGETLSQKRRPSERRRTTPRRPTRSGTRERAVPAGVEVPPYYP